MTIVHADDWLTVHSGDCRAVLATMPERSVHTVVTSPPYWGLRDYGTATWDGGGPDCDHRVGTFDAKRADRERYSGHDKRPGPECERCGAIRIDAQLGLEPTPEAYVANMVDVFRAVRRVLRDDGTLWLNLGDSYSMTTKGAGGQGKQHSNAGSVMDRSWHISPGLKPKDLVGIPWRVAFALQADGWYLRSDIIWAKPNPMPESVTDRPTKAHEYLFLLAKSERYYFDADAVREPSIGQNEHDLTGPGYEAPGQTPQKGSRGRVPAGWDTRPGGHVTTRNNGRQDGPIEYGDLRPGRNIRSVWTIATQPYPGAHFATFPPKLVEPCILAGTSERGVCAECGSPWRRVVERVSTPQRTGEWKASGEGHRNDIDRKGGFYPDSTTTGWQPTCDHDAPTVPATVLDPFGGSGTTAMVAQHLSRRAVLIDLNPDYIRQQMERNGSMPLGLGAA